MSSANPFSGNRNERDSKRRRSTWRAPSKKHSPAPAQSGGKKFVLRKLKTSNIAGQGAGAHLSARRPEPSDGASGSQTQDGEAHRGRRERPRSRATNKSASRRNFPNINLNCLNQTTIKDYDIHCMLGQGAFGTVQRAVHRDTGRRVAIKQYEKSKLY